MATLALGLVETVILSSKATNIVGSVGTNIIVGTITTTTSSIGRILSYLTTSSKPGLKDIVSLLGTIDLEFTIGIIDQVVREQNDKPLHESIKKALLGVNEILNKIHKELETIQIAIDNHQQKYFSSWRSFEWDGNIENLKCHNDILKNRYDMLVNLLKIYSK
jgi:hypothetical protein